MAKLVKQHLKIDVFGTFGSDFNRRTFNEALKATLNNLILISKIGNKKSEVSYLIEEQPIKSQEPEHA